MGSSGSGNFTDYSKYKGSDDENQGGSSGDDKCERAFSTRLDEVGASAYYLDQNSVPALNTPVELRFDSRLSVLTMDGVLIGYLPTRFNYLAVCIRNGFSYAGTVVVSNLEPIPSVEVDMLPVS